jgi:hypothetical protein
MDQDAASSGSGPAIKDQRTFPADGLSDERDRLVGDERRKYPGTDKVINGPIGATLPVTEQVSKSRIALSELPSPRTLHSKAHPVSRAGWV